MLFLNNNCQLCFCLNIFSFWGGSHMGDSWFFIAFSFIKKRSFMFW